MLLAKKQGQRGLQIEAHTYIADNNFHYDFGDKSKSIEHYFQAIKIIDDIRIQSPDLYKTDYLDANLPIYGKLEMIFSLVGKFVVIK